MDEAKIHPLDIGLKGGNITLQVGQKQVARVVNKTGGDLFRPKGVSIRGMDSKYENVKKMASRNVAVCKDVVVSAWLKW
ncbi:MAG: hypothetical protein EBU49_13880 [Proteobacteria bacterium]|nr:hypothetical protein [Pseudomonadota bacterium]